MLQDERSDESASEPCQITGRESFLPRKVERDDGQVAAKHVDDLHRQVDPARTRVQADTEVGRAYSP